MEGMPRRKSLLKRSPRLLQRRRSTCVARTRTPSPTDSATGRGRRSQRPVAEKMMVLQLKTLTMTTERLRRSLGTMIRRVTTPPLGSKSRGALQSAPYQTHNRRRLPRLKTTLSLSSLLKTAGVNPSGMERRTTRTCFFNPLSRPKAAPHQGLGSKPGPTKRKMRNLTTTAATLMGPKTFWLRRQRATFVRHRFPSAE